MGKSNSELLELLAYYDDLTEKQAECISQMSRMIARQALEIAMLRDDILPKETAEHLKGDMNQ